MVDKSGKARITDFGLAATARNPRSQRSTLDEDGHSARWCAPKVLKSEPASKESDIFSFGMVILGVGDRFVPCQPSDPLMKVLIGGTPFGGEVTPAAIMKIVTGKFPIEATARTWWGNPSYSFAAELMPISWRGSIRVEVTVVLEKGARSAVDQIMRFLRQTRHRGAKILGIGL